MLFRVGGNSVLELALWLNSISVLELELVKLEINETEIETLGIGMKIMWMELEFLAVAKQLYEWFSPSVCPSVLHIFTMFIKKFGEL